MTYPPPPYHGPPAPQNTEGLVGMILGIMAIPLFCCGFVSIPMGIAAFVLGLLGKRKADAGLATNRGQAIAAIACGAAAAALGAVVLFLRLVSVDQDLPDLFNQR